MQRQKLRNVVRQAIHTHHVQDGDIVVLIKGSNLATQQGMKAFAEALARQGYPRCIVAISERPDDLTVLNEEQMRGLGWQRIAGHPFWESQSLPKEVQGVKSD